MLDDLIQCNCGVIGVWGTPDASKLAARGLHFLQHRGHEHCGIVSESSGKLYPCHEEGTVKAVFTDKKLKRLRGNAAIGHVKYTTQGSSSLENAQPFLIDTDRGPLAIAHNGEFANQRNVKRQSYNLWRNCSGFEIQGI